MKNPNEITIKLTAKEMEALLVLIDNRKQIEFMRGFGESEQLEIKRTALLVSNKLVPALDRIYVRKGATPVSFRKAI